MNKNNFSFRVEGEDAQAFAGELAALIEKEFGEKPELVRLKASQASKPTVMRDTLFDLTAAGIVIGALVALPQSILATLQLMDRFELDKKFKKILDWFKEKQDAGITVHTYFMGPDGEAVSLEEAECTELSDLVLESRDQSSESED